MEPIIVSLNKDAISGFLAIQSKTGMPIDFSKPLFPVSTEYGSSANPSSHQSLAMVRMEARAEPGAPVLSASPKGVRAKRRPELSVRMPRSASERIHR